jgi:hypothetical protein
MKMRNFIPDKPNQIPYRIKVVLPKQIYLFCLNNEKFTNPESNYFIHGMLIILKSLA